jgi:hypothetical protein
MPRRGGSSYCASGSAIAYTRQLSATTLGTFNGPRFVRVPPFAAPSPQLFQRGVAMIQPELRFARFEQLCASKKLLRL